MELQLRRCRQRLHLLSEALQEVLCHAHLGPRSDDVYSALRRLCQVPAQRQHAAKQAAVVVRVKRVDHVDPLLLHAVGLCRSQGKPLEGPALRRGDEVDPRAPPEQLQVRRRRRRPHAAVGVGLLWLHTPRRPVTREGIVHTREAIHMFGHEFRPEVLREVAGQPRHVRAEQVLRVDRLVAISLGIHMQHVGVQHVLHKVHIPLLWKRGHRFPVGPIQLAQVAHEALQHASGEEPEVAKGEAVVLSAGGRAQQALGRDQRRFAAWAGPEEVEALHAGHGRRGVVEHRAPRRREAPGLCRQVHLAHKQALSIQEQDLAGFRAERPEKLFGGLEDSLCLCFKIVLHVESCRWALEEVFVVVNVGLVPRQVKTALVDLPKGLHHRVLVEQAGGTEEGIHSDLFICIAHHDEHGHSLRPHITLLAPEEGHREVEVPRVGRGHYGHFMRLLISSSQTG
mmetsp:Transcript_132690/g.369954  ORF Transcript_132690/g.369954 Transcript_132690/m.369954 type:complete len:453 (-) Transcript_132690:22-1380(-)